MSRSIRSKISILSIYLIISTLVLSLIATLYLLNRSQKKSLHSSMERTELVIDTLIGSEEFRLIKQSELVSSLPIMKAVVETGDLKTIKDKLIDYQKNLKLPILDVYDNDGQLIATSFELANLDDVAKHNLFSKSVGANTSTSTFSNSGNKLTILAVAPIGSPVSLASLVAGVNLDNDFAMRVKKLTNTDITFITNNNQIVGSSLSSTGKSEIGMILKDKSISPAAGTETDDYLIIFKQLKNNRGDLIGKICIQMSLLDIKNTQRAIFWTVFGIGLTILFATMALAFYFSRSLSEPIVSLKKLAENIIETNNLNQRAIPIGDDEIAALANSINHLLDEIQSIQISLVSTAKLSALGEMAGGIAHEINNPLAIISSTNHKLRRLNEDHALNYEDTKKCVDSIDKTIVRITKIVHGLKVVSRDATNEEFLPVKLRDLMEDVLSVCIERLRNNGVVFIFDLENNVYDNFLECRRVQLSQIFINLINNSYDAIENNPEKWIKIECIKLVDTIEFKIIDCGSGIPLEIQEKIFAPFFTTKPVGKGTGLGLSLSVSIIKDHSGTFKIDNSNPNTCFVIDLPFARLAS